MNYLNDPWNNYQGLISDDTLRLTTSDIEYFGVLLIPSHCAGDTMTYDWFSNFSAVKVKHKKLIWSNKQISTNYDMMMNIITLALLTLAFSSQFNCVFIYRARKCN